MTLRRDRLFRCVYCGGWRYNLSKPCFTCELLKRREYLGRGK